MTGIPATTRSALKAAKSSGPTAPLTKPKPRPESKVLSWVSAPETNAGFAAVGLEIRYTADCNDM